MGKERWCVATFAGTHDALRAEQLCQADGVPGRLVPLPVEIDADCGLAWRMPPDARARFEAAVAGALAPAGYHEVTM